MKMFHTVANNESSILSAILSVLPPTEILILQNLGGFGWQYM